MLLASTALRGGQYDLAIAEYRQVLDQNPKSAAASLSSSVTAYLQKGRYQRCNSNVIAQSPAVG